MLVSQSTESRSFKLHSQLVLPVCLRGQGAGDAKSVGSVVGGSDSVSVSVGMFLDTVQRPAKLFSVNDSEVGAVVAVYPNMVVGVSGYI